MLEHIFLSFLLKPQVVVKRFLDVEASGADALINFVVVVGRIILFVLHFDGRVSAG